MLKIIRKKSDNSIIHTHSITGGGNYPYTDDEIMLKFGYNPSEHFIEDHEAIPQDAQEFNKEKQDKFDKISLCLYLRS